MNSEQGHRARKRFGQNFLVDTGVIDRIVRAINPKPGDTLVEIGPGQGALTEPLLVAHGQLHAVELDRDLVALLHSRFDHHDGFVLHEGDALDFPFDTLVPGQGTLRVVGNLPYNISTPLIFHLLTYASHISDMHFMLQKEVVQRLAADPGSKTYGRLSVIVQYHCRVEHLFTVPPHAFSPAPKVESAIVRLTPHRQRPWTATNPAFLSELVNACFQQRRKTLRNTLKPWLTDANRDELAIDLGLRPENLSVGDFVTLSNTLGAS